jgi:uncharacterized protein (TIGR02466 family)
MARIQSLFPTLLYRADKAGRITLNAALEVAALDLATHDTAGIAWCEKHGYAGYTSYGSRSNLSSGIVAFRQLTKILDMHAAAFAKSLHWDIRGGKPMCDSLWVNVLPEGGSHASHLHANSVISGTYYVTVPAGSGPLLFEDPRLAMLMAAPPQKASGPREMRRQISESPAPGTVMMWESWLRHEVPINRARGNRISVSFNYVIGNR